MAKENEEKIEALAEKLKTLVDSNDELSFAEKRRAVWRVQTHLEKLTKGEQPAVEKPKKSKKKKA